MSKKVLILKQGGVQQFQSIGGRSGPSFMDLARRVGDPTASGWQKVLAGAGMAGKTAAGIGAINQTVHQMQGGNAFAPLNINYAYQGLDPTTGMQSNVTPGEQQDQIVREKLNDGKDSDLRALTDRNVNVRALAAGNQQLPPPAGLPAETPVPAQTSNQSQRPTLGPPGSPQRINQQAWNATGRGGNMPPGYTAPQPVQPQVQPQPVQTQTALPSELISSVGGTSVPGSVPQQPLPQPQPQYGPNPPPLPPKPTQNGNIMSYVGPPASTSPAPVPIKPYEPMTMPVPPGVGGNVNPQPQQDPTHGGRVDEANLKIDGVNYFTQAAFDAVKQREGLVKSFVQAIYDEMGDALYKADPHVAGLIISRIYMDKFVR